MSQIGCIVCLLNGYIDTPATMHHIRHGYGTGQRAPDEETIPLCKIHHQTGDGTAKCQGEIGYHYAPQQFEDKYGTELELLELVNKMVLLDYQELEIFKRSLLTSLD